MKGFALFFCTNFHFFLSFLKKGMIFSIMREEILVVKNLNEVIVLLIRHRIDSDFLYYFDQGKSYDAYRVFGAHLEKDALGNNVACEFCLFAPNAASVSVVGEWNQFEPEKIK